MKEKQVTIIKLPAHTTDVLQPLDVSVFKSLKDHWGSILLKRIKIKRKRLSKPEFLTVIASEDEWKRPFSEVNIKNNFQKCGILPCDQDMYPKKAIQQETFTA